MARPLISIPGAPSVSPEDFPVQLYSTGNVPVGGTTTLDADDLQNAFQKHVQIEEIRFLLYLNAATNLLPGALAPLIRVQLKMGRIDLTNGFVPLWLLGTRMQRAVELANGYTAAGQKTIWDYQRWRLPKPIIVPHGATLLPSFSYQTPTGKGAVVNALNSPITVYVCMVGRSLKRLNLPAKLEVPYATFWLPSVAQKSQQSGDDALVNKFTSPLHVQRFIGRIASTSDGTDGDNWASDFSNVGSARSLRITDSAGFEVVRDMTIWNDVFERSRCALPANRVLEPRGWYRVLLNEQPSINYVPMISLIGWRHEELVL